jgi:hypothetical protein
MNNMFLNKSIDTKSINIKLFKPELFRKIYRIAPSIFQEVLDSIDLPIPHQDMKKIPYMIRGSNNFMYASGKLDCFRQYVKALRENKIVGLTFFTSEIQQPIIDMYMKFLHFSELKHVPFVLNSIDIDFLKQNIQSLLLSACGVQEHHSLIFPDNKGILTINQIVYFDSLNQL